MSGGFIPDHTSHPPAPPPASTSSNGHASAPSAPLLSLTPRQESRLRTHLDDRLLSLERDDRKHAFGNTTLLVLRLNTILNLILQIPPVEPWAALRISYLLTFTGSTITYLTSVPLVDVDQFPMSAPSPTPDFPASESDGPDASRAMRTLLEFLKTVERGWQAVLRGDAWVSSPESSDHDGSWKSVKVDFAGQVGTTERIRLKSIIIAGREKILAWARSYGHFTGSRFPEMCRDDDEVDEAGWEAEVLGMWNGTLDMLASGEDQGEDGYA